MIPLELEDNRMTYLLSFFFLSSNAFRLKDSGTNPLMRIAELTANNFFLESLSLIS